jgi:hypothetical protein
MEKPEKTQAAGVTHPMACNASDHKSSPPEGFLLASDTGSVQ